MVTKNGKEVSRDLDTGLITAMHNFSKPFPYIGCKWQKEKLNSQCLQVYLATEYIFSLNTSQTGVCVCVCVQMRARETFFVKFC
jgi:hypothetical protein